MQFGIMETKAPGDRLESVAAAADAGFEGIELDVRGASPADDAVWSASGRNDLRRRAAAAGVAVPSLCLGYLNRGTVTADDPGVRARAHESVARSVDAAAALGADVVLVPFFGDAAVDDPADERRIVEHLRALAPTAAAAGVTLAVETALDAATTVDLLDAVDSPAVGVYHDTGNPVWAEAGDPAAMIRTYGDRMARIHFKDHGEDGGTRLGEGAVDFDAVAAALEAAGYDGWIVLETAVLDDPLEDAAANLAFARDLFA